MPFELSRALLDGVASSEEEEAVQHKSSFESFEFLELPLKKEPHRLPTPTMTMTSKGATAQLISSSHLEGVLGATRLADEMQ